MRPMKIPALKRYPTARIATADDDILYPPDWFEQLVRAQAREPHSSFEDRRCGLKVSRRNNLRAHGVAGGGSDMQIGRVALRYGVFGWRPDLPGTVMCAEAAVPPSPR